MLISGVVSLTLTPMLCSRFLKPPHGGHSRLYRASERVFDGMLRAYDVTLQWTLRHRRLTLAVLAGTLAATVWLFVVIPKGFIPNEDNGTIFAFTEAAQDISFESMMVAPEGGRRRGGPTAVRPAVHVVHRRQRVQHGDEQRPHLRPAQAAVGAQARRRADHRAAPEAGRGAGHPRLPADPADDPHRRPAHQGRLPVHAAGRRTCRSSTSGRRSSTSACASCPACRT